MTASKPRRRRVGERQLGDEESSYERKLMIVGPGRDR
jgi:hypothetical protein